MRLILRSPVDITGGKSARLAAAGLFWLLLASCGGGGSGGTSTGYSISVTVSNLQPGTSITLLDNGQNSLTVTANGTVTIASSVASGTAYSVTVSAQPTGETCTVSQGSGTVGTSNVNVGVACATNSFTVSVTVNGLTGGGLVLELNGTQDQTVASDGTVTFPDGLATGASYAVTVKTQPTTQREICGVSSGSGTIAQANVTNVAVNCSIVVGFLYQTVNTVIQTQATYQLLSYGISQGTGALLLFGTPIGMTSPSPGGMMVTSPGGGFLIVSGETNTGSTLSVYSVNSDTGALTAVSTLATAGLTAGYLAMSPQGFLFVSGTGAPDFPLGTPGYKGVLVTYQFDASTGTLTQTGTPLTLSINSLAVRPDGKFLYVVSGDFGSNTPVTATLTAYAIDGTTGALTAGPVLSWTTSYDNTTNPGSTIGMDALGRYLYLASEQGDINYAAATVLPYAIDAASGALTPVGTGTPVASNAQAMVTDPSGRYLYVLNDLNSGPTQDTVLAMAIDQSSGVVSPLGSPLETGGQALQIMCDPSGQFLYASSPELAAFAISTAASTAGQLVPNGQFGPSGETVALAIVE
jgi:6-phosphogluconolactonase (cycloisomerase 2 family)